MDKIPLTNYQFIAYFLPGLPFITGVFITLEQVQAFPALLGCMKDLSIGFLILSLILSFIVGLIFDAVRNGVIDNLLDWMLSKEFEVNWKFFYTGKSKKVGFFYARYFSYYCFDFNMVVSLTATAVLMAWKSSLLFECRMWVIIGSVLCNVILCIDAISLRKEMHQVTHQENEERQIASTQNE
jgi:heme/copper-type cytochrome/quinol oxidase subunit 4